MAKWSDMERSMLEMLWICRPVEQTRSRMCPLLWVGKLMCCVRLEQFNKSRRSLAFLQLGESICRLKSPRSRRDDEVEKSVVMNSDKSDTKDGCGLGGR